MPAGKNGAFASILAALLTGFAVLSLVAATLLTADAFNLIFLGWVQTDTLSFVWPFTVSMFAILAVMWIFARRPAPSGESAEHARAPRRRIVWIVLAGGALVLGAFLFVNINMKSQVLGAAPAPSIGADKLIDRPIRLEDAFFSTDLHIGEDEEKEFKFVAAEAGDYIIDAYGKDPSTDLYVSVKIGELEASDDDGGRVPFGARTGITAAAGQQFIVKPFAYAVASDEGDNATIEIRIVNPKRLMTDYRAEEALTIGGDRLFATFADVDKNLFQIVGFAFAPVSAAAEKECLLIEIVPDPASQIALITSLFRDGGEVPAGMHAVADSVRGFVPANPLASVIVYNVSDQEKFEQLVVGVRRGAPIGGAAIGEGQDAVYSVRAFFADDGQSCEEYLQGQSPERHAPYMYEPSQ